MLFSDGVFFDPADKLFKMWYMAGYQQHTALAVSNDGMSGERPALDVVRGTNIVAPPLARLEHGLARHDAPTAARRYKMACFDLAGKALHALHLGRRRCTGASAASPVPPAIAARSSATRSATCGCSACARKTRRALQPLPSLRGVAGLRAAPDGAAESRCRGPARMPLDIRRADYATRAGALQPRRRAPYESVMLGLFTMYRGERPDREKPNDMCVGFSRDGFHWSRDMARAVHPRVRTAAATGTGRTCSPPAAAASSSATEL